MPARFPYTNQRKSNWKHYFQFRLYFIGKKSRRKYILGKNFAEENSFFWLIFVTYPAQKMKISIKNFFSKRDQIRRKLDLVTFTEEILNGKLHFLCSISNISSSVFKDNAVIPCFWFIFNISFCWEKNWRKLTVNNIIDGEKFSHLQEIYSHFPDIFLR